MNPRVFSKYCLLDRISVGGMAEVFRVRPFNDRGFTGFLALKRILPNLSEDEEFVKMFLDEATLTAQLRHKNIVRVHELGCFKDAYFIVMEYISGRDILAIQKTMRRRRDICPVDFAALIMFDAASGLAFAHQAAGPHGNLLNIIHRDVSPQNIVVQYDGVAKLIDFGIAKATIQSSKTKIGVVKGKVGYMSPEQVKREPLTQISDLFSLSTVFWELVTNQRLFRGENEFDTMNRVREAKVVPPSSVNPAVPPEIDAIIMKGLSADPSQRFQTAAEMAGALHRYIQMSGTSRQKLARWMQAIFEAEVAEERELIERYRMIQTPQDVLDYLERHQLTDGRTGFEDVPLFAPGKDGQQQIDPADVSAFIAVAEDATQIRAGGFSIEELQETEEEKSEDDPIGHLFDPAYKPATPSASAPQSQQRLTTKRPAPGQELFGPKGEAFLEPLPPPDQKVKSAYRALAVVFLLLLIVGVGGAALFAKMSSGDEDSKPLSILGGDEEAHLSLTVSPNKNLSIFLDGVPRGTISPIDLGEIKPGNHVLTIRSPGHQTYIEHFDARKGNEISRDISLKLASEKEGRIVIDTSKLGPRAQIYIDGKRHSRNDVQNGIKVKQGPHLVDIVEQGRSSFSELIEVDSGLARTLRPVLHGLTRRANFPPDMNVTVNGRLTDNSGGFVSIDKPQKIVLEKDNEVVFDSYVGFPEIAKHELNPESMSNRLKRSDFGWLVIRTSPDWWLIKIDGIETGLSTPIDAAHAIPIRSGKHELELYRANASRRYVFDVKPGATVAFQLDLKLDSPIKDLPNIEEVGFVD